MNNSVAHSPNPVPFPTNPRPVSLGRREVEDLMMTTVVRPVQFFQGSRARSGEQLLALAVLRRAVQDLQEFRYAHGRKRQRLYMEAYRWMASEDASWDFSFVNICEILHLSPESLREELLEQPGCRDFNQAA